MPVNLSVKWKGILSLIGAIVINIVMGTVYMWSNINSYFISYWKYNGNPDIDWVDGFFLMPIVLFISYLAMYVGPKIEKFLKLKKTLVICVVMIISSHFGLLFSKNIFWVYFEMIVFGIANGFCYIWVMKNAWLYFPNSNGLVSGLILLGYGWSSWLFTTISDEMVNPNYEKADEHGFFSQEISMRVKNFLIALFVIWSVLSLAGFFWIFDFYKVNPDLVKSKTESVEHVEVIDNQDNCDSHNNGNKNDNNDINNKVNEVKIQGNEPKSMKINKADIREIYCDKKIWQIITMNFCTLYFCFMITNTNRSFGQLNSIDESIWSSISKAFSLINGCGRLFWGFMFDRFGFKWLYTWIVGLEIVISASIYFIGTHSYIYFLAVCLTSFILSGNVALMLPWYPKIFSIKYSSDVYGIAVTIYGFSSLLGPIVAKFWLHKKEDYKVIYLSGTLLATISFVLSILFKETPFQFKNKPSVGAIKIDKMENINLNHNNEKIEMAEKPGEMDKNIKDI